MAIFSKTKRKQFQILRAVPETEKGASRDGDTWFGTNYLREEILSLFRDMFSLPVVTVGDHVKQNLPNRMHATINKLTSVLSPNYFI